MHVSVHNRLVFVCTSLGKGLIFVHMVVMPAPEFVPCRDFMSAPVCNR